MRLPDRITPSRALQEQRAMPAYEKPPAWRVDVYSFLIFVRFQLSSYKVNAIDLFTTAQVISIVLSVLAAVVTGIELDVSGIASSIGMIVITRAYYAKRAKFFVN